MERPSPSHEMVEASEVTVEHVDNVEGNGNKLNTPPTTSAEVSSPASSSKRGRLRAASLVGSPSAARGFGNQSVGFGAGLPNVPPPITTTITQRQVRPLELTKADDIHEPRPVTQLPGITETLKEFAPSLANQPPVRLPGRSAPVANDLSVVLQSESRLPNGDSQESDPNRDYGAEILNIYTRRADQIGPSHRIPGIGHLGDLLPPPGWELGDDPITETEAQKIFTVSRSQAKEKLDQNMSETSNLSSADQEKFVVERNAQYQAQRALDEFLLLERVKLYHFSQERKQKLLQQMNSQTQQNRRFELKPTIRPQPLQPPAETSMMAYQRHQQLLVPASPHLYGPSPPLSGGTLNARINFMQQGLHIPQASPMSPTFLDPGLVPQTLEAVYNCYARNQVIIMNMNNENERFLTQWSAKFQVPRPRDPVAPGVIPFITGQRAAPFGSIHYGYMPQDPNPWTPSQAAFGGGSDLTGQTELVRQTGLVLNRSNLKQGGGRAPSHPVNRIGPFRYPDEEIATPEGRKTQVTKTPESKKRGRTPKADKSKILYAEEIAEANLPTSIISQAALKAGMDFMSNEDRKQTPPKPKGRRGMPVIDAKKGFVVSADAAKALIAKGAADARPKKQLVALETSTNKSADVSDPSIGVVAGYQAASYPSAATQATSVITLQRDEDTISAPTSASGPSSDTPDDPKDTNYGQKVQRKPASTHTTAAPRKAATTAGKKRKSTEAGTPAKKRTRQSVDGAADDE